MEDIEDILITKTNEGTICLVKNENEEKDVFKTIVPLKVLVEIIKIQSIETIHVLCDYLSCEREKEELKYIIDIKKELAEKKRQLDGLKRDLEGGTQMDYLDKFKEFYKTNAKTDEMNVLYYEWNKILMYGFCEDGKFTGLYEELDSFGKPKVRCCYKKDKLNGLYQEWWRNGKSIKQDLYEHGVKI